MTFAKDIEEAVEDAPIVAVVIGDMGWTNYNEEGREEALARKGEILTWDEASPLLRYQYDDGYGAPECNAVYVYTDLRVYFVGQYDGSTCIYSIPRNPTAGEIPIMPGG